MRPHRAALGDVENAGARPESETANVIAPSRRIFSAGMIIVKSRNRRILNHKSGGFLLYQHKVMDSITLTLLDLVGYWRDSFTRVLPEG